MRLPEGVVDASCLIGLDGLDLVPQLAVLFHRILIPKAVRGELNRRRRTKDRINRLRNEYEFLVPCDDYDQGAVDVLLIGPGQVGKRNRGEAEAVVQAATIGAMVLVDDRWGRKVAQQYPLELHGTLWVLERLHEVKLLRPETLREHLHTLMERGFRLPSDEVNRLLERVGQPRI